MTAGIANADAEWAQQFLSAAVDWGGAPLSIDAWDIHNYLLDTPDQYDVALFQQPSNFSPLEGLAPAPP